MLRTATKPKWLALLLLVVIVGVAFVQLGRWQLGVAQDKARVDAVRSAGAKPAVPLTELLRPHQAFPGGVSGRLITATGTYADTQIVVPDRLLDGVSGYWVLTPLVLEGGGTLPVVRGHTTSPQAPPPPAGPIELTAALAPGESPSRGVYPAGQLGSVDLARLVNSWPGELYNGFGFAQVETLPAETGQSGTSAAGHVDAGPLQRVPPPLPDTGVNWRNAAYALQWWVFAAFAFWLWLRMVKADHDTTTEPTPEGPDT